ncbi:MAG TPA: TRAM domain-containing protein [Acidimicrobiales bacterium]|nr:TRAM domain-containing protein [Acidimicrobiales bacterium]
MGGSANGYDAPSAAHTLREVALDVTSVVAGGAGLAREPTGRVVFVRGGLPGERVIARLTEERRDFARAQVVRVLDASPDRVEPPCRFVALGCGGCEWQHVAPEAQARYKRSIVVDALRRIARIDDPPVADTIVLPPLRYRTTVRIAVDRDGRPAFRKFNSHDLVTVDDCLVLHPSIASRLRDEVWPDVGEVTLRLDEEIVAGRHFDVSPGSFFQIRSDGAEQLVALVAGALTRHDAKTVVDLYAGVGLFAATMHDRGFEVLIAVEGNKTAVADARRNLAGVCPVVSADVAKWQGIVADAVIADPSRDGLRAAGVATVLRCAPDTVVLVSCDPAALARDAKLLSEAGFALETVQPLDMFVQTPHIEVVSTFVRL